MNDEVLFTFQWAAVVDGLHRELGMLLKRSLGVTYLMFCLMASVRSHEGRMTLADFPRGTLANDNTVVVAANGAVHRACWKSGAAPMIAASCSFRKQTPELRRSTGASATCTPT
ncbi:hypothetical protein [Eggerthella sinensis]|uniref:hypothetical protein n=1 Tax=Eggerthella sinensis TaxID=242230 RepID=UPI0022E95612|nr:hypothetical protein [Eggerthella sinensis]